jgi:hypothetical protein
MRTAPSNEGQNVGDICSYYAKRFAEVPDRLALLEIIVRFFAEHGYDCLRLRLTRSIAVLTIAVAVFLTALNPHAFAARQRKATSEKIRPRDLLDINHASVEELKTLPGIQDALAAKIIRNRPYANKTQLSSKGIVSAAAYRKIRALIIAKQ